MNAILVNDLSFGSKIVSVLSLPKNDPDSLKSRTA